MQAIRTDTRCKQIGGSPGGDRQAEQGRGRHGREAGWLEGRTGMRASQGKVR